MAGRDDDNDDFVERYVACSRLHTPRPKRRSGGANGGDSDAARMRKLFDIIKTQREEADWTWADVIAMLEQSHVRRRSGKPWSLNYVRGLYQREADRRAGRGTWRVIRRERANGSGAGDCHAADGGDGGGAPGGTHVVAGSGGVGTVAGGGGVAGAASPEGTGGGAGRGGEGLAAGEVARAERAPAGMGEAKVESRMSLRPRPKPVRRPAEELVAEVEGEPAVGSGGKPKPAREWGLGDDLDYWGDTLASLDVIGPPPDWDGVSMWSDRDGGWRQPDGTVRPAVKVERPM